MVVGQDFKIPVLGMLRQENLEFWTSLYYIAKAWLKTFFPEIF
jgi:hypothetical protein